MSCARVLVAAYLSITQRVERCVSYLSSQREAVPGEERDLIQSSGLTSPWWGKWTRYATIIGLLALVIRRRKLMQLLCSLSFGFTMGAGYVIVPEYLKTDYSTFDEYVRYILSTLLQVPDRNASHAAREVFFDTPVNVRDVEKTDGYHSHPVAAAVRTGAVNTIMDMAVRLGLKVYSYQGSHADFSKGLDGSRSLYEPKDLAIPMNSLSLEEQLLMISDVDYHIDMPKVVAQTARLGTPTIVAGFQPQAVCGSFTNGTFSFLKGGKKIRFNVSGGAYYEHSIWNYSGDHATCVLTFCGLPYKYVALDVSKRHISEHYALTLLQPTAIFWGWRAALANWLLKSEPIKRYDVSEPTIKRDKNSPEIPWQYNRMLISTLGGDKISIGLAETAQSITIPIEIETTLLQRLSSSGANLTPANIQGAIEGVVDDPRSASALLHRYYVSKLVRGISNKDFTNNEHRTTVCEPMQTVQPAEANDLAKTLLLPFCKPFLQGLGFVPMATQETNELTVRKRMSEVANKTKVTPLISSFIEDFTDWLADTLGRDSLDPVSDEEVEQRQNKPNQVAQNVRSRYDDPPKNVDMFVKPESSQKPTSNRPIANVRGSDKTNHAAFIYAISDAIKAKQAEGKLKWYAFGRNGHDMALRVAEICSNSEYADVGDFEKFDGRVGEAIRNCEMQFTTKVFKPEHKHKLIVSLNRQKNRKCVFQRVDDFLDPVVFKTENQRLSGSAETANFNTVAGAFNAYVAVRHTVKGDRYMTHAEAIAHLEKHAIFGGDDSLVGNLPAASLLWASTQLGMVYKSTPVEFGALGINFLSRFYTREIWRGNPVSCCDIRRILAKLHLASRSRHTPVEKLKARMVGLAGSDPHTPIIGKLAAKTLQLTTDVVFAESEAPYAYSMDAQYPNSEHKDFDDYVVLMMPNFNREGIEQWIDTVIKADDLLLAPGFDAVIPSPPNETGVPMVINGNMVQPAPPTSPPPLLANPNSGTKGPGKPLPTIAAKPSKIAVQRPAKAKRRRRLG